MSAPQQDPLSSDSHPHKRTLPGSRPHPVFDAPSSSEDVFLLLGWKLSAWPLRLLSYLGDPCSTSLEGYNFQHADTAHLPRVIWHLHSTPGVGYKRVHHQNLATDSLSVVCDSIWIQRCSISRHSHRVAQTDSIVDSKIIRHPGWLPTSEAENHSTPGVVLFPLHSVRQAYSLDTWRI